MQDKLMRAWFFVCAFYDQHAAFAVEVKGLFETELVARSQLAEDRNIALKQALFVVLDRILVSEDIAKIPVVRKCCWERNIQFKQSQYSLLPADEYADTDARLFRVQFDEDQILEVLRKAR